MAAEMKKEPGKPRRKRSTGKGALIKGMTKRLPSAILEDPMFDQALRTIMRRYGGIYALYRKSRL